MRAPAAAAAAVLLPAFLAAPAPAAPPEERPFPAPDRGLVLKEARTVYLLEGRARIPEGVEVVLGEEIALRAKGGPAFLEVAGSLTARGERSREVLLDGVTVVPAPEFRKVDLEWCTFREGGGLATDEGKPAEGPLAARNCRFQGRARLDIEFRGGSAEIVDVNHAGAPRLRGASSPGSPCRARAVLLRLDGDGLRAEGLADLEVRQCRIRSDPLEIRDVASLLFDGNKVEAPEPSFSQSRRGGFARARILRTDFYSRRIAFAAPGDPAGPETVSLERCWFGGITDPKAISERVADAADDPARGVRVILREPQEKALGLGGPANR